MKQFQITYNNDETFINKLEEINQWCNTNSAYATIFRIYSQDMNLDHIRHICDILDDRMPEALYLGCTANANILDGVLADAEIILTCTVFEYETTKVDILQFPFLEENVKEDVAQLKEFCAANPWVNSVEMHATIMDMSMKEFCDEMSGLPNDIQVFGGGAFNPNMDDDTAAVFSKGNGFLEHGIVFLLLGGSDFHTYSTFISGWKPLGCRYPLQQSGQSTIYGKSSREKPSRKVGLRIPRQLYSTTNHIFISSYDLIVY